METVRVVAFYTGLAVTIVGAGLIHPAGAVLAFGLVLVLIGISEPE